MSQPFAAHFDHRVEGSPKTADYFGFSCACNYCWKLFAFVSTIWYSFP